MNWPDYVLIGLICLGVVLAIVKTVSRRRKGEGCSGDCFSCRNQCRDVSKNGKR